MDINNKKNPFCQFGQLCDHPRYKYSLEFHSKRVLRKVQSFPIEGYVKRACIFAGALWLPYCFENRILIYTFDGLLLQEIQNFAIERPFALWEYNDKFLLVAASNGLFMLEDQPRGKTTVLDTSNNGQMVTLLREGSFCDIYIEYPHAVYLEYMQGKVYVTTYKQTYGRQTEVAKPFKLQFESDYLDSVFVKTDHVYVSSCTQHSIFKYNLEGVCLTRFGQPGQGRMSEPGCLMFPTICGTISKQEVLVIADALNDRLQVLDLDDEKFIIVSDNGVKYPVDAVLDDNGMLLVLSGKLNDYKVHKFEIIGQVKNDNKTVEEFAEDIGDNRK